MSDHQRGAVAISSLWGRKLAPEGSKLVLTEWTIEGGSTTDPQWMAPLHIHHDDDEAWYVIEGSLRVRVGNDEHDVPAGGAVLGPHGVPHTFCNSGPDPARYLLVMSDRTSALLEVLHSGKRFDPEAMRELYEQYGCQLLE